MKVREANISDTDRIVQLVKEGLDEFGFTYSSETSELDLQNIENEYFKTGGTFIIIEDKELNLIATGALKKLQHDKYKIRKMYVRQNYRSKGYGALILNNLIQEAKKRSAKQILLETSTKMEAAVKLYEKRGFVPTNEKAESPRCNLTMKKDLIC